MKKVFLSVIAIMVALAASAQNKAIEDLAAKYADREGITVVNMAGDMIQGLGDMAAANGGMDFEGEDISELLKGISTLTVIVSEKANEEFAQEIRHAVDAVNYTPMVSHASEGTQVKILTTDIRKGKNRGNKEIVISVIDNNDANVLVRVIGDIDPAVLSKLMEKMKNKGEE